MKKILFIYTDSSTFVRKDIDILKADFLVDEYHFKSSSNKLSLPFILLKQLFFLLGIFRKYDLVISQFGAYHSFLPALFSKLGGSPFLIIAGGSDCNSFPALDYGNLQRPILKTFTALSFKLATHISPKHDTLISYQYKYSPEIPAAQGLKELITGFKTPYTVIYNGYESEQFICKETRVKNSFITIATGIEEERTAILKGIDLILKMADKFPESTFIIIGNSEKNLQNKFPKNVQLFSKLPFRDLLPYLCRSEFYFQLSMSEGFPNALCEAMLCGCIPIGSEVNSIPEIIGDTGFMLERKDEILLENIIKKVMQLSDSEKNSLSQKAKEKITIDYPLEKRNASLLDLAKKLS